MRRSLREFESGQCLLCAGARYFGRGPRRLGVFGHRPAARVYLAQERLHPRVHSDEPRLFLRQPMAVARRVELNQNVSGVHVLPYQQLRACDLACGKSV